MAVAEFVVTPAMQRILLVLGKKSNMSISDLSQEAFVGITTLAYGGYIQALRKRKLIYVSGWRKVKGRFATPLFSRGNLTDVPRPLVDETNRDAPGMHRILETLERYGALTYLEIAQFSGLSKNTVKNSGYLDALIAQSRIHIGGWRHSHKGPVSPIYTRGPGAPVAKPPTTTGGKRCEQHRMRAKIAAQGTGLSSQIAALTTILSSNQTTAVSGGASRPNS